MSKADTTRELMKALQSSPFELALTPLDQLAFHIDVADTDRLTLRNAIACVGPAVRVSSDLDLSPEILVMDLGLGTIGLVYVLEPMRHESLADQAKRHVDQATYLRHLLATEAVDAGTPTFRLDYTVECVLAVALDRMHEMVLAVREIAARTRLLHATGLNLLPIQPAGTFDASDVRRAFAWLLPSTRQRIVECAAPSHIRLRELSLSNYRLPGERPWVLTENRVHLLHGANGTGKSSIAEALELVVTGSVERIKNHPSPDYAGLIRNIDADSNQAPVAVLRMSDDSSRTYTVTASGVAEEPMARALPVSAFRLDQITMDLLVRADSQQRARALTRAFFPGDAYDKLEQAQREFNGAYRDLPLELRQRIQSAETDSNKWHMAVNAQLKWVNNATVTPANAAECLPLKREQLEVLARIVPEIKSALDSLASAQNRTAFKKALTRLDDAVGPVRSDARRYREAVIHSMTAMRRLSDWTPSSDGPSGKYSDVLRNWSDRVALTDLLQKHLEISRTLIAAREAAWIPDPRFTGLFVAPVTDLQQSLTGLIDAAERCATEQKEQSMQLGNTSGATKERKDAAPAALAPGEITALNLTGSWFVKQEPTPPKDHFGDAVQAAITGNTTHPFGSITIGSQSWTSRPGDLIAPLEAVLNDLIALEPPTAAAVPADAAQPEAPVYRGGQARWHAYRKALAKALRLVRANRRVEKALMNRLAEHKLNEALDEVITLFTPARWAYEGLFVSTRVDDGKVGVDLLTAKTRKPAEIRLNTAELNLVVLALYLLCGPTIANPLGTLILDDPLQNMDELTAATVARGVAKVAALLPDGWQLLLMFHGDEDLETFRREVPASVYRLPWLGPIGAKGNGNNAVHHEVLRHRMVAPKQLPDVMKLRRNGVNRRTRVK